MGMYAFSWSPTSRPRNMVLKATILCNFMAPKQSRHSSLREVSDKGSIYLTYKAMGVTPPDRLCHYLLCLRNMTMMLISEANEWHDINAALAPFCAISRIKFDARDRAVCKPANKLAYYYYWCLDSNHSLMANSIMSDRPLWKYDGGYTLFRY